ncbi:hypothetical protein MNR01_01920 [Lysobacter sp. S4-A87]|uniref:flavodoxin family protein n=1 Tax=Lysobacter sp. S4-A87 TaxID=2925843 RepID=UPI001F53D7E7|nr:hypothetical protein [Lysobacter sp. S4-A87]UNK49818.1 hypothetical protein MNR01_01920 [Lysobacter sp. S4-A87]
MARSTLIAYYSRSGHTRAVAHELRQALNADIERITEPRPRRGALGALRTVFDVITRRSTAIVPARLDPAGYGVLLIGGPVWAGRMAAPVRSFAKRYGGGAPQVAFFCTEDTHGSENAFVELELLCGRSPLATLVVDRSHLPAELHCLDAARFIQSVKALH